MGKQKQSIFGFMRSYWDNLVSIPRARVYAADV